MIVAFPEARLVLPAARLPFGTARKARGNNAERSGRQCPSAISDLS